MSKRRKGSNYTKWGIIGSALAGGAALITFIPTLKRRAMRVSTILKKDHRMVSGLIATLQMTPRTNTIIRKKLFDRIYSSLMIHMQAEEEVLYPAMRNHMVWDNQSKVEDAYHDHEHIKDMLTQLSMIDLASEDFDGRVTDLKMKVQDHIVEEEGQMLMILAQRMPVDQQEELGRRIHNRKSDLKMRMAA